MLVCAHFGLGEVEHFPRQTSVGLYKDLYKAPCLWFCRVFRLITSGKSPKIGGERIKAASGSVSLWRRRQATPLHPSIAATRPPHSKPPAHSPRIRSTSACCQGPKPSLCTALLSITGQPEPKPSCAGPQIDRSSGSVLLSKTKAHQIYCLPNSLRQS